MSSQTMRDAVRRTFELQAAICRAGDAPISADLLEHAGREVAAGGPVAAVVENVVSGASKGSVMIPALTASAAK